MYNINQFKDLNSPEKMVITQHCRKRFTERGIQIDDICNAISTGEIIEDYPDDFPFPSCLILGKSAGKMIHIVASIDGEYIYLITAYIPDRNKWDGDFRTRKEDDK